MLALIAAALVSTNVSHSAAYLNEYAPGDVVWTNERSWASAVVENVRNRCVVDREITCPACNNTSTQQVDITDVYTHYEDLRSIDRRCHTDMARMLARSNEAKQLEISRAHSDLVRFKDSMVAELRRTSRAMYVSGYTNALSLVVRALRNPCKTCALRRVFTDPERRLMRSLADTFEEAAEKAAEGGTPCPSQQ